MKNGYTPREYAHSLAVDALIAAHGDRQNELAGLTSKEVEQVRAQLEKLIERLANAAKLDYLIPSV
jgi:hypothetical protein